MIVTYYPPAMRGFGAAAKSGPASAAALSASAQVTRTEQARRGLLEMLRRVDAAIADLKQYGAPWLQTKVGDAAMRLLVQSQTYLRTTLDLLGTAEQMSDDLTKRFRVTMRQGGEALDLVTVALRDPGIVSYLAEGLRTTMASVGESANALVGGATKNVLWPLLRELWPWAAGALGLVILLKVRRAP